MQIEKTVKIKGTEATFRNTMRAKVKMMSMVKALDYASGTYELNIRSGWINVCAYGVAFKGVQWKPIDTMNKDVLEANFEAFLDAVPEGLLDKWQDAIFELRDAWADKIEKPDSHVTEQEASDPNS